MNARHLFLITTLCIAVPSVSLAAKHAAADKAQADCKSNIPRVNWVFTDTTGEYKGIVKGTKMTLQRNGAEWQITLSKEATATQPPPPVETLHLVKVCGGSDVVNPPGPDAGFMAAAYYIMNGKNNYYAAMGSLDGTPTLALIALNVDKRPRTFTLIFVKVEEVDHVVHGEQGGILHGQEN